MKVARQALPGKWNLTHDSRQGRLTAVYYRRFVESATYPYPEKQHAKKSSQKREDASKAVWAGRRKDSAVPVGTVLHVLSYPAVPFDKLRAGSAGLFSVAPIGASRSRNTLQPLTLIDRL